jgi:DNA-3-methyladenine glycosylase
MQKLGCEFFERPTLQVAQELLGKKIFYNGVEAVITETEAYIAEGDPACHAARGKTPRNAIMFGKPGFSYVYFIYGMYHCLNFVTEKEGVAAAVLIRGVKIDGVDHKKTNGPGKLCKFLNITREQNAIDIVSSDDFCVYDSEYLPKFQTTPRIGIRQGKEHLWRFVVAKSD